MNWKNNLLKLSKRKKNSLKAYGNNLGKLKNLKIRQSMPRGNLPKKNWREKITTLNRNLKTFKIYKRDQKADSKYWNEKN